MVYRRMPTQHLHYAPLESYYGTVSSLEPLATLSSVHLFISRRPNSRLFSQRHFPSVHFCHLEDPAEEHHILPDQQSCYP